jgi:hypothetical protein
MQWARADSSEALPVSRLVGFPSSRDSASTTLRLVHLANRIRPDWLKGRQRVPITLLNRYPATHRSLFPRSSYKRIVFSPSRIRPIVSGSRVDHFEGGRVVSPRVISFLVQRSMIGRPPQHELHDVQGCTVTTTPQR